ncbi:MAG: hypothetical protein Q4C10_08530 [Clostridia bacterium]|nr:hypothetical protein [Clostridia bacterium]
MKQRHKIMTAVCVAATVTVLFAALALAAGTMLAPRVDRVATAPRGGAIGEASAPQENPVEETDLPWPEEAPAETAEALSETRSGGSRQEEYPADQVYYATQGGKYFHIDEHCGGMHNAYPLSWDYAWISSKLPCPVCVDADRVPRLWFYCTGKGMYYHLVRDCSGMLNAEGCSPAVAEGTGKGPCPVCVPASTFEPCWATPMGQYYHKEQECMAMKDARVYTVLYCEKLGKQRCPVCW